jgi:hypothetical protein
MNNELIPFDFGNQQVRVVICNGEPWFVAKDVCDILGLSDVSMSVQNLDDDEKLIQVMLVSGQNREVWTISESGLYAMIFKSRKPEAKTFRKWVTAEVLPAIRKTGHYGNPEPLVPFCNYPFFNRPDCAVVLAELRQCLAAKAMTIEEFRHIVLNEETNVRIASAPGAAPRKWKLIPAEEALDRFVESNLIFAPGSFEGAKDVHKRYVQCGGPDVLTQNQFTSLLISHYREIYTKQKRPFGYPEQVYMNIRLTKKPMPIMSQ